MPIKRPNGGKANVTETLILALQNCTWRDDRIYTASNAERYLDTIGGTWFLEPAGGLVAEETLSLLQNATALPDGSFLSGEGAWELHGVGDWATAVEIE